MSDRMRISDESLDTVYGGNITFDWDGKIGHCGLNGDKSYTFYSRSEFVSAVIHCFDNGLTDAECLQTLIDNGVIQ